ncbi:methyl-accepting chemotaxis protein [Brachyspira hyodysenteriae]|uniref:methyl-accepting chemotaxis protein n=1 Tax=Brachyspira hyodysenteriae TaxID=159 RepID=UPI000C769A1D|nr:methyl-accepting chemotaxis protein [Brachyspira hyodysenteriae]AUJ49235.1 methyl-accepting chemotaxis protein [Brachyspira hyodysenteriae]MCZ9875583.1 methyl-accepting chemotaxis protein [Brachyspira hyodysenteriae]MCZ9900590.1 methyl-accepting chemotaxis protein [Brachyspira hyodysenteriae]MCZ9927875.1 methyl-accepting chemotaxis protein [Brachyspira hyodysenteriae]MCZ9932588.1 methyl-accepting chemotaxis protein [Brachyspira hyodysenteriae]
MVKKFSLQIKISLAILVPLLIMLIISNSINIVYVKSASKNLSHRVLEESSKGEAAQLLSYMNEDLYSLVGLERVIRGLYNDGTLSRPFYERLLYSFFDELPQKVNGLLIAFEPNMIGNDADYTNSEKYGPANGRFNYYLSRNNNFKIQASYFDMKIFQNESYTKALSTGETYISDVYKSPVNDKDLFYTWSLPIKVSNKVIGVICLEVFANSLYDSLSKIKLFEGTTITLFDNAGTIVYDSDKADYISKTLDEIYPYYNKHNVFNKIISGENLLFENFSGTLKKFYTYSFTPVEISKGKYWGLKITAPNDVILRESNIIKNIMFIISALIVIISAVIVPFIIKRKVTKLIGYTARDITKISNGDISFHISKDFLQLNDEWGDIARGLENTLKNLGNVVSTVKKSAEQVSNAANEVLVGNNDLSQRTETQASSLEETAASMNQMASAIKESAEGVSQSTSMVMDVKECVNKAGVIIEDSVNKMDAVYESSSKIMDITKLIEGIAFQTNILALNASVEAARAGDQGRGFAVVASEVRNLAQNTQESVKNITSLITDSNNKIKLAASSVQESQTIFNEILEKMDNVSNIMDKINTASQEQEKGIDQVNMAIDNMDSSVQKNASLVSEATSASESLLSEANDLIKAIEYFKLKS